MGVAHNFVDLAGRRFGSLVILAPAGKTDSGEVKWLYRCDCGAEGARTGWRLKTQRIKCWHHPYWGLPGHRCWRAMLERCYNRKNHNYPAYGGAGITVCERWRGSFHDFIADMGPRPTPKHTIDRWPNPWGNYEPGNCRWATVTEQNRNKRTNVYVDHEGERVLLVSLAAGLGLSRGMVYGRLKMGWSLEDALTVPVRGYKPRQVG